MTGGSNKSQTAAIRDFLDVRSSSTRNSAAPNLSLKKSQMGGCARAVRAAVKSTGVEWTSPSLRMRACTCVSGDWASHLPIASHPLI